MKRTAVCLAAVVTCWSLTFASPAFATPFGVEYLMRLDATVIDLPSGDTALEGHQDILLFGGDPDLLLNNIVPPPPFALGNDLIVDDQVLIDPSTGIETFTFWIEAEDPGAPLFVNTLDLNNIVFFEVSGLHWNDPSMGAVVKDIEVIVSFPQDEVVVDPFVIEVSGLGTPDLPLGIAMDLDASDFYFPFGDIGAVAATDLHLSIMLIHVPEPSTLLLTMLALVGLIARGHRRRRA